MSIKINSPNIPDNEFQKLLGFAALFEEDFSIDWLEDLIGERASKILSALEYGIHQDWLIQKGAGIFCFSDMRKRKHLEGQLTHEEGEQYHRRIAEILAKEPPDDDNKILALAYHLRRIKNDEAGCHWLMRAGDIHRKAFRTEEYLKCNVKILEDLAGFQGKEADKVFIEAAINYSKVSRGRYNSSKTLSILQEALIRAKNQNIKNYQALLKMHLAKNEWLCSRHSEALNHFEEGWSLAKELDEPKLLRSANTFVAFFLYWQGRFKEVISHYEKFVPEVQKYPQSGFPLFAAILVGYCYHQVGQVTQGLGMLDSIRAQSKKIGDLFMAAEAGFAMAATLLEIGRMDDALRLLVSSTKEAKDSHNEYVRIRNELLMALVHYLKKNTEKTICYLHRFTESAGRAQIAVRHYPYLLKLCWAIKKGGLPSIPGLSLEEEVIQSIEGNNIFMKGVAYRYQALLQRQQGLPHEKILETLDLSLKYLEESGHQVEMVRSRLEIAHQHILAGDEEKAKEMTFQASKIFSSSNQEIIPDDLRFLNAGPIRGEKLMREILNLGQEIVNLLEKKDLTQHIISKVNQLTGAERGAIFLWEGNGDSPTLQLRASKNLTYDQVNDPIFASSMKLIEKVAITGKGLIVGADKLTDSTSDFNDIRSRICVPMVLKDKVIGVLYHDNRLLSGIFEESDLELLAYFAAWCAIALDNAKSYMEIKRLNHKLKEEKQYYEEQHFQNLNFEEIVGESSAIKEVLGKVEQVANTETTILVYGETGVGKELVAQAIHRHSPRCKKPFIRFFCSAIPETLIPSELFGHEKGAFTGAIRRRIGRFELADGGTLFLDEIGDLSLDVQVRLLRVLQSKEFERIGGNETLRSDFRLVVATNRDLDQEVKAQRFRRDLYYRLNIFPIYVPPLRERKEDIPLLVQYFLKIYATKMGKVFEKISNSEMDKLIEYDWPGNVRELENIMERAVILSSGPLLRVPVLGTSPQESSCPKVASTLKENERSHILWALQRTGWKVRGQGGAAELLEIHPSTLTFRIKKLGIQKPPSILIRRRKSGKGIYALT